MKTRVTFPGPRERTSSREEFLKRTGKCAAALTLAPALTLAGACASDRTSGYPFTLGVASGDPLPDGVVLWTRLALEPVFGGLPNRDFRVRWEIAEDEEFRNIVRRGEETAVPALAHSVHAEVDGLRSDRPYYYRFEAANEVSPVGRTKTAPARGSGVSGLSFAYASCQGWTDGEYPSYAAMAEEDLDFVVHLGDYIYEEAGTRTIEDFRRLHALYKSSPDLQRAHAAFPFIAVLDDHEVDNDWAGDVSEEDEPVEEFRRVRAAAYQAYYEHMPLRRSSMPRGPDMRLHRRFDFGDLVGLNVLDTRRFRDDQVDGRLIAPRQPESLDANRTMMGDEQERWLFEGLDGSRARWNVIAQQTMMAKYDYDTGSGESINHDQWDGYSAARDRLLAFIERSRPENPVVVSGDWHASFVNDLNSDFDDPASQTLATEFVGTSISSSCPWADRVEAALPENPHVKYFDGSRRGYVRCEVSRDVWRTQFRTTDEKQGRESWVIEAGAQGARPA